MTRLCKVGWCMAYTDDDNIDGGISVAMLIAIIMMIVLLLLYRSTESINHLRILT